MVLKILAVVLVAGCSQSLFDANGKPDASGGDDDEPVPSACPSPCLGDAAADFDGTPTGTGDRWAYLDDKRNRTWTAMQPGDNGLIGDGANAITTCTKDKSAPACAALPGALVVSGGGTGATADPAIAFPARNPAVLQLTMKVRRDDGGADPMTVRLYRNSREDSLVSATAYSGTTLEKTFTVDALAGDRFFVALEPTGGSTADRVAVQFFVNDTGTTFPSKCQLALTFSEAAGTKIDNLCGADVTSFHYNDTGADTETPPALVGGPFAELGMAADFVPSTYYKSPSALDRSGETTTQLWVKLDAPPPVGNGAWVISDHDLDATGGLGIVLFDDQNGKGLQLDASTCTVATQTTLDFARVTVAYPADKAWHLIRAVHKANTVSLCVDGALKGTYPLEMGKMKSTYPPHVGMNVIWTPRGAFVDGQIDDVRVFSTALPCE